MKELINYNVTDQAIADLAQKYATMPSAITEEGYKANKEGHKEVRAIEISIDKKRKELNQEAQDHIKKVNNVAKELTGRLEKIRLPMTEAVQKEDNAKAEAERLEKERKINIENRLNRMVFIVGECLGGSSEQIKKTISKIEEINTDEGFDEYEQQAIDAKDSTLIKLREMLENIEAKERQDKEIAELRAKLAAQEPVKQESAAAGKFDHPLFPPQGMPEPGMPGEPPVTVYTTTHIANTLFTCFGCGMVHDMTALGFRK